MFGNYRLILPILICVAVIIGVIAWLNRNNTIGIQTSDQGITISKAQIESVRNIGEWEFLAINHEGMIDSVRRGIFYDDQLVRIYYGTLRLGIDMHRVKPDWIVAKGDTIAVTLPPVGLLDEDFIDETRTKSFYERGKWTPEARKAMRAKAYRKMKADCLTKKNIEIAQNNADLQMRNIMKSMGFNNVTIRFDDNKHK